MNRSLGNLFIQRRRGMVAESIRATRLRSVLVNMGKRYKRTHKGR